MLVELDVKLLIDNQITAEEFLIADLLVEKAHNTLEKYLSQKTELGKTLIIENMVKKELLNSSNQSKTYDLSKLTVSEKFIDMISKGDYFDELVNAYPAAVTRPDGSKDYIRTDLTRCRKRYAQITKNKKVLHKHILKCLQFEVNQKTAQGKLGYMKRLTNWLASEEWKSYEQVVEDRENNLSVSAKEDINYGAKLE